MYIIYIFTKTPINANSNILLLNKIVLIVLPQLSYLVLY